MLFLVRWYLRELCKLFRIRHGAVWSVLYDRHMCQCGEEWPCWVQGKPRDYRWHARTMRRGRQGIFSIPHVRPKGRYRRWPS